MLQKLENIENTPKEIPEKIKINQSMTKTVKRRKHREYIDFNFILILLKQDVILIISKLYLIRILCLEQINSYTQLLQDW